MPSWRKLDNVPLFEVAAFTRQLDESQWRWYSHDPATLRAADAEYRDFNLQRDNFTYFDRKRVSILTEASEWAIVGRDSFLDDAAKSELRDVSWIDPNFVDLSVFDPSSNDDHPPSDVRAGQALVLDLYEALAKTRDWRDTLLVITYDEHGGFYDHVAPPAVNDGSGYATYGIRVPALVVGPRVKQGVCKERLDHGTLVKTIVRRFAKDPEAAIRAMGSERIKNAPDLDLVLVDEPRSDIADHRHLRERLEGWRTEARKERMAEAPEAASLASDGAGQPLVLNDFQQEFMKFAVTMREKGLPPGQP